MIDHEHQPFIRAVIADPTNDLPRLAYAEWLVRRGDPRGEFIRAEIEAYSLRSPDPYGHRSAEYEAARDRAEALLAVHYAHWTSELSRFMPFDPTKIGQHFWTSKLPVRFLRGFPESFRIGTAAFLEYGELICATTPARCLTLSNVKPLVPKLAKCSQLQQIVGMFLSKNMLEDSDLAQLLSSPYLSNLLSLAVSFNQITDAGVELLVTTKNLPRILEIELQFNPCQNPNETGVGYENVNGRKILDHVELPAFGQELEQKYGEIPWLHAPSRVLASPLTAEWCSTANLNNDY